MTTFVSGHPDKHQLGSCLLPGYTVGGSQCQLMTKSHLRDGIEPAGWVVTEVTKQHDMFACAIADNSRGFTLVFSLMN